MFNLSRFILSTFLCVTVIAAIFVTTLRLYLPHLDRHKDDIQQIIQQYSQLPIEFDHLKGFWQHGHPNVALYGLHTQDQQQLSVGHIQLDVDLLASLWQRDIVLSSIGIHQLDIDISQYLLPLYRRNTAATKQRVTPDSPADHGGAGIPPNKATDTGTEEDIASQIQNFLFHRVDHFSISEINIRYPTLLDHQVKKNILVNQLTWDNLDHRHQINGQISHADGDANLVQISGDFHNTDSLLDITGNFYIHTQQLEVDPWLNHWAIKNNFRFQSSKLNSSIWLQLKQSQPTRILATVEDSELSWQKNKQDLQKVELDDGQILFTQSPETHRSSISSTFSLRTNERDHWSELTFVAKQSAKGWLINSPRIDIADITPFLDLSSTLDEADQLIKKFDPQAIIQQLRFQFEPETNHFQYSAHIHQAAINAWQPLPALQRTTIDLSGSNDQGHINVSIDAQDIQARLFNAPFTLAKSEISLFYKKAANGWQLWSDRFQLNTQDLNYGGAFRIDLLPDHSPHLSLYSEADIHNVGNIGRYLPREFLGEELTDYLSSSLQEGSVRNGQILWYGELAKYPFADHDGILQTNIPIQNGKFQFDPQWPPITELQLDVQARNDSLYLKSNHAHLMDAHSTDITAVIPKFSADGHFALRATTSATGRSARNLMLSTPFAASVGAALTNIDVDGMITGTLDLHIPFNLEHDVVHASGEMQIDSSPINLLVPKARLDEVTATLTFQDDQVNVKGLQATLLDQPITVDISAASAKAGYQVQINTIANWQVDPLYKYVDAKWLSPLQGQASWQTDAQLTFTADNVQYKGNINFDISEIASEFPAPMDKKKGQAGKGYAQFIGNKRQLSARLKIPHAKLQTEIDLTQPVPQLTATFWALGNNNFRPNPLHGHLLSINTQTIDLDAWLTILLANSSESQTETPPHAAANSPTAQATPAASKSENQAPAKGIVIPLPEQVSVKSNALTLGSLNWHNIDFNAAKGKQNWHFSIKAAETEGTGRYLADNNLIANLNYFHLFLPQFASIEESIKDSASTDTLRSPTADPTAADAGAQAHPATNTRPETHHAAPSPSSRPTANIAKAKTETAPQAASPPDAFEQKVYRLIPNTQVNIKDLWLQGYKSGQSNIQVQRLADHIELKEFTLHSGQSTLNARGTWSQSSEKNHTKASMELISKDYAELMARFGKKTGIQQANLDSEMAITWDGAPWDIHIPTLAGNAKLHFDEGLFKNVSNAARLLGFLSFNAIFNKLSMDFSGAFDDGIAFNSLQGSAQINKGIVVSNDIEMDSPSGDMELSAQINLNKHTVNAEMSFVPNLTSLPILSAFAVNPATAIYVIAISTVLSPVVDVFTKISYTIIGPFDDIKIKESSRSKGKYKLPEDQKNELKSKTEDAK